MIKGFSFAISLSAFITSAIFAVAGMSNNLQESLITGGVIGTSQATSYSTIAATFFFITTTFLFLNLKNNS